MRWKEKKREIWRDADVRILRGGPVPVPRAPIDPLRAGCWMVVVSRACVMWRGVVFWGTVFSCGPPHPPAVSGWAGAAKRVGWTPGRTVGGVDGPSMRTSNSGR